MGMKGGLFNSFFTGDYSWWGGTGSTTVFDDLISYWSFPQTLKASQLSYDSVSANSISVQTNVTRVAGKVSADALRFTGTNSYVTIRDNSDLRFDAGTPDSPFAFEFWIFPTNQSAQRWILNKRGTVSGTNNEYQVTRFTDSKIRFTIFSEGGVTAFLTVGSSGTAAATAWSHVVVSYDGSGTVAGMKIWINGVAQTLTDLSTGTYVAMTGGIGNLVVGNQTFGLTSANGFIGDIDGSIGLFNRALTQTDVDYLYKNGDGRAYTTSPNVTEVSLNILAVRGNYQFASNGTNLYWSNDNGATWINAYVWGTQFSAGIPVYNKWIDSAHIFSDGTVLFSVGPLLFRSTDQLVNISAVTAYDTDGVTPYVFHTPIDATRPGAYFQAIDIDANFNADDILVWSNYCNVDFMGASPTVVWMTDDKGLTVQAIYKFGQNPSWKDNGGSSGGTGVGSVLLGDVTNSVITRHGHSVVRTGNDWYTCFGDHPGEAHWFKHTRNPGTGLFTTTQIVNGNDGTSNTRWMAIGLFIVDSYIYWVSDATSNGGAGAVPASERGVFKTSISDIKNTSQRVLNLGEFGLFALEINSSTGKMIIGFERTSGHAADIGVSTNFGSGDNIIYIPVPGMSTNALGNYAKTADGYCKVNSGRIWENITRTFFVKM